MSQKELTEKLGFWSYYKCEDGKESFFYGATFIIYDTYQYDFGKRIWLYRS